MIEYNFLDEKRGKLTKVTAGSFHDALAKLLGTAEYRQVERPGWQEHRYKVSCRDSGRTAASWAGHYWTPPR